MLIATVTGAGGKYDPVHERRMKEMKSEIRQQGVSCEFFSMCVPILDKLCLFRNPCVDVW